MPRLLGYVLGDIPYNQPVMNSKSNYDDWQESPIGALAARGRADFPINERNPYLTKGCYVYKVGCERAVVSGRLENELFVVLWCESVQGILMRRKTNSIPLI